MKITFVRIKILYSFTFITILLCLFSLESQAEILIEDFENFNISNYYETHGGFEVVGSETPLKPDSSSSLKVPVSSNDSVYLMRSFTPIPSSTWVWVNYYMWAPPLPYTLGGFLHLPSLNWSGQYVQLDFRGEQLKSIVYNDKSLNLDIAMPFSYFQGKWSKIQMGVQYSTKSVQIWVDDIKVYDHTNVGDLSTTQQANMINFRCHKITTLNAGTFYFDELSISTDKRPDLPPAIPTETMVQ